MIRKFLAQVNASPMMKGRRPLSLRWTLIGVPVVYGLLALVVWLTAPPPEPVYPPAIPPTCAQCQPLLPADVPGLGVPSVPRNPYGTFPQCTSRHVVATLNGLACAAPYHHRRNHARHR